MASQVQFTVSCSWATEPTCKLENLISVSVNDDLDESFEASHEMTPESFIQLSKLLDDSCTIDITFGDPYLKITDISIVSEAKFVELYGKFGEYIKTVKGQPLESVGPEESNEECYSVYSDCLTSKEIGIKFAGLKDKSSLWIYGIKLLGVRSPLASTNVDYSNVSERLKSSHLPLSEKAEKCKEFLQSYSKLLGSGGLPPGQKPSDRHLFMQMMAGQFPGVAAHLTSPESASAPPSQPPDDTSLHMTHIKGYIDDKLEVLERRVTDNFEKQLKDIELKQNAKLDSIIQLLTLQSSKS